jgi:soluble lytic murein transglycosylase
VPANGFSSTFRYRLWRAVCLLWLGASCPPAVSVAPDQTLVQQRALFLEARQALANGDRGHCAELLERLGDYALVPYLRYEELRGRLAGAGDAELQQFLEHYRDSPVSARLRAAWLAELAEQGRWAKFLEIYQGEQGTELQCQRLQGLLATGHREAALQGAEALWMSGRSQPSACDPAFSAWRAAGRMTPSKVWDRIRLAVEAAQWSLAGQLAGFLSPADQRWVEVWRRVYDDPFGGLDQPELGSDGTLAREIISYGIGRLARRDAQSARERWGRIEASHRFPPAQSAAIERDIALQAAYQHHPRALEWLTSVQSDDPLVGAWRVRAALWLQNWRQVLHWVRVLPPDERREQEWRYWEARALDRLGERSEADRVLAPLSQTRDYYGFLAADRLERPYSLQDHPIPYTEEELRAVESIPGVTRARELFMVGMTADARREWHEATRGMGNRSLQLAAVLARRWGWLDRAIVTAAKGEHFDDLELRFPLAYRDVVLANANARSLDPAWIYGILRQESAFWTDARSSAGAIGLMQLMPRTAAETARRLNDSLNGPDELLEPGRNIRLGSAYLRRVLDRFDGHETLATAAYNAGPQRVRRWLPEERSMPADAWVETIPLTQTRRYVEHVMEYAAIYGERLGRASPRLAARMPPVAPEALALTEGPPVDKMPYAGGTPRPGRPD